MLYGRDAEASAIAELLAGAKAGRSGVLVISGEAGIGKSALLDFAEDQAGDAIVLRAAATETEAELPYSGLHLLLRPLLGDLAGLPAAQADALRQAFRMASQSAQPAEDVFLVGLAGRAGPVQPRDRRAAVPVSPDGRIPPVQGVPQAGRVLAERAVQADPGPSPGPDLARGRTVQRCLPPAWGVRPPGGAVAGARRGPAGALSPLSWPFHQYS